MLNFLLDIAPDKSQLLLTIKLAGILREKKQEVYYTYTSNPAFTPVLYNKGISNCVLYPDDFRWLKPDLTLLDCRHAAHASLYRQLAIDYIFIAMQLPNQKKHTGQRYFCTLSATHSLPVIWFRTTCGIVGKEIAGYKKRQRKKYYCRIIGKRK